jgi:hypothetical protein
MRPEASASAPGARSATSRTTPRTDRRKRRPPFAFWKGAALGLLGVIPLCALAVWTLARLGLGNGSATMIDCLRMASVFSGLAAVLTAGGVGRLSAQASVEGTGGRRRAALVGARAMAAGGAALTLIAAIPLGHVPTEPWGWLAIAAAGALAGAVGGALIGVACGGQVPTLTELGVWPIEPIGWTRDLLGLDDRRPGRGERRRRPDEPEGR